jgi:pyruvate/2-oxoglutarate/acetoin dehydrogenase E1 component
LNRGLASAMARDPRVMLIGEDLVDPYGGAFKASKGLSTAFPDQVVSTPIAEAAIAGVSNGLALAGLRPIAEIMFADFVTLAVDQIVNHAAKFHYMYANRISCPLIVRMPSGGRRGYGPTHSQSTEQLFLGVPGLRVIALSRHHDVARLMEHAAVVEQSPTILVENKMLYSSVVSPDPPLDLEHVPTAADGGDYPPMVFRPRGAKKADVTLVSYGGAVEVSEAAMRQLIVEDEVRFDFVVLTQLWPLSTREIAESVQRTGRLVVVEEGVADFGIGAAVIAAVAQRDRLPMRTRAVGMKPVPIPCAKHLEDRALPSTDDVAAAIRAVCE